MQPQEQVCANRRLKRSDAPLTQAALHPCTRLEMAIDCKEDSEIAKIRAFVPASHLSLQFNRNCSGDSPNCGPNFRPNAVSLPQARSRGSNWRRH
ncbi:MAG: hypothetical protein F6K28_28835 [Microcoleus sp. SIO2G3]|nr:hypothetical protein [Microcoleus sp. SIO2G3]